MTIMMLSLTAFAVEPAYVPDELVIQFKPTQSFWGKAAPDFNMMNSVDDLPLKHRQLLKLLNIQKGQTCFTRPSFKDQVKNISIQAVSKLSHFEQAASDEKLNRQVRYVQEFQRQGLDRVFQIKVPAGVSLNAVLEQLREQPEVEWAEKNYYSQVFATIPNDPQVVNQYALSHLQLSHPVGNPTGPGAWDITTGSATVVIAVIDSGLDTNNTDFSGRLWVNPSEIANNSIDDDGNGKVDDVNGWNFVANNKNIADDNDQSGSGCVASPVYHGTHVAGVIAANANNSTKIAGTNWNAKLMILKVTNRCGSATNTNLANAISYAASKGANIINISLGGSFNDPNVAAAVAAANSAGVIIVAAMGNSGDGTVFYPAGYSQVIGVGATDFNDNLTSYSTFGNGNQSTDVVAPGDVIVSTTSPNSSSSLSGTSFASPYVAGVASLILAHEPTLNADAVRYRLQSTATDLGSSGYDQYYGYGLVNAYNALTNITYPVAAGSGQISNLKNYPNPVRLGQTFFSFVLKNPANITVRIFNLQGYLVHTIVMGQLPANQTQTRVWDLKNSRGQFLGNGTYIYQVESIESSGVKTTMAKRLSIVR